MAANGRGPIKVGSGYIEINPRLSEEAVRKFRAEMDREMVKAGRQAGKSFTESTTEGLAGMQKAVRTAAKKAGEAAESEAKDSAETIAEIERHLTKQFGDEAVKRFREMRRYEEKKRKLVEESSKETLAALKETTRQETAAHTARAKAQQKATTDKERQQAAYEKYVRESNARIAKTEAEELAASKKLVETAEAAKRKAVAATAKQRRQALEDQARMDREIAATQERLARQEAQRVRETERQKRRDREDSARMDREIETARLQMIRRNEAAIREELRRTQLQRQTALRTQLDDQQNTTRQLRRQLTDYRNALAGMERNQNSVLSRVQKKWRTVGNSIETLGTHATEAGNLITNNLLAPLGLVAGALTTIGIKSADMRILGQMGLTAAGVDKKTAAGEMAQVQQYAIDTPFSVDVMHEYQMKLIRSLAAADPDWYKKSTKTTAANQAAGKTTDLIMAVGDSMARAGNLDPAMFERAMYALDRMSDSDKASTRSINQLVASTGLPAPELAQMFGFNNAGEFWKVVGTPVTKGGGVSGTDMMNNLLRYWDPNYFKKGKDGKPLKDKNGQPIVNTDSHSTAGGSKGYGETMTSATITGRIQQMTEGATNKLGAMFAEPGKDGKYQYTKLGNAFMGKGGVLDEVGDIGKSALKQLPDLLMTFAEQIKRITGWIKKIAGWLDEHPGIKDAISKVAEIAVVVGPLLIGMGILTKTVGKLTKIMGAGLTPVRGAFSAMRGTTRVGRQALAGTRSWAEGGSFRDGYRDRRTQLRGGDTRGPVTRARDRVTGRNSQADSIRTDMDRVSRQIQQAEDRTADLRDRLREVAGQDISRLARELAGTGNDNVAGAARDAQQQVRQIQTQGLDPLNRVTLTTVRNQITDTTDDAKKLVQELKDAQRETTQLDGKKLTQFKVTVDGAHGTVTDLKNKVDDTSHSVGKLDGKSLSKLKSEFDSATRAADSLHDKVGSGEGSGSVAGRIHGLNERKLTSVKRQFENLTAAADGTYRKIGQGTGSGSLAGRVGLLNGRSLKEIRGQFVKLTDAAEDAYKQVGQGTGGGSLAGRIGLLNNRKLTDITKQVKDLKSALKGADGEAEDLNNSLDDIANHKGGGSSKKSSGPTKKRKPLKPHTGGVVTPMGNLARFSMGGVLPGYLPGVDKIPAILSPGEAILRPEVTASLGPELIHSWNAMARKGQLSRYAGGGIVGKFGIDKIVDLVKTQNIWPDAEGALATMRFDAKSNALGGDLQGGMLGAGKSSGRYIGSDMAGKFNSTYDFIVDDSWQFLKRLPTVVGQIVGIIGGAVAPTLGDYFHDDIWKGNGNIIERGNRYLHDVWSGNTLTSAFDNLFGGVWDSVKAIAGGAKELVTDPVGSVEKTVDALWTVGTGEINQVIGMVKAMKSFWNSPMEYASDVVGDIWDTAQEALPNMEGLFDFSDKDRLNAKKPTDLAEKYSFNDPPGKGVMRWKPSVQRVLKELGLSQSYTDLVLHRIQVESGGNPKAINNWDSNAKAGYPSQGLMQTIPQTFAAYAGPYRKLGITNGLASIYAGLNYAVHRYGSGWPKALSGTKGYWTGTNSASPGLALVGERGPELIDFGGGERVYNNQDTTDLLGGKKYEIHIHEAKSEDTTQATIRALKYMENVYGI
ncbi:transglycosylase SLT domain-containing protein [Streptomyces malaysiensis]|uniref:transglycosylase SLT domain-containing protein n=1 Tax=Streptomyces malaysiensis TaxID=92644 RepID=UPI0036978844